MDTIEAPAQGSNIRDLLGYIDSENPFDVSYSEVLPRQVAAINERLQDRREKIKLLQNRADAAGISEVRSMADVVPLLFAHTAYKSYPEAWLGEKKWDRLAKWLDTVSTRRVEKTEAGPANNLDGWLSNLEQVGHYVSCSSGTTGKCAMMNASSADLEFAGKALVQGIVWAGLPATKDRQMISVGQVASTPRNIATGAPMMEALSSPDLPHFAPNVPAITIGSITNMVVVRKKIADGTAHPSEVADYEAEVQRREAAVESAVEQSADAIIANREHNLHISGLFGPLYQVAERVRSKGYSGKDFAENSTFISGGLKRAQVPDNFKDVVAETFNFTPERTIQAYGMQELNSNAWKCKAGRYHMTPWVMLMLLDESGENLIEPTFEGEVEGRAAFFDLSLEGRWGGVITGDKVRATWAPCDCGHASPSIADDIQRYADTASGDKIACSGTIDAYIRGEA